MNLSHFIPRDDLLLAELPSAKLADVLHGIMSVGVACLELKSPTDFLTGKDRVLLGFLEVLRCIGVKPGHADKVELLRQPVDQLADLAVQFHSVFMELGHWRNMPSKDIREVGNRLAMSYAQFFQALGAFCSLLGLKSDYSAKVQQGRDRVDEFLRTLGSP